MKLKVGDIVLYEGYKGEVTSFITRHYIALKNIDIKPGGWTEAKTPIHGLKKVK